MRFGIQSLLALKLLTMSEEQVRTDIADKAKPRVIVGRKATGPIGIAGLPKQEKFCGARGLYFHEPLIFRVAQFVSTENARGEETTLNGEAAKVFKR